MSLKQQLLEIFANDAEFISERDAHYKSSWKSRGGVGAFFTIARPWDRFEAIAERGGWDIFKIIKEEQDKGLTEANDGTLQACIRDLRAYMALLAAEAMTMRQAYRPGVSHQLVVSSPKEQEPAV